MKDFLCLFIVLGGLAACGTTPAQQAALVSGAITLAQVAAANNTTAASLVAGGTLFCAKTSAGLPLIVALANAEGAPVAAVNQTAAQVAGACAAIAAIPTPPPIDAATALVVAVPTALPATSHP